MWGKGGQAAAWGGAGGDWGGGAKGGGWGGGAKGGGAKGGGDKGGWGAPDPWMMMMMKAKGKGKSKGWGGFEAAVAEAWGIEGLTEALQASLAVIEGQDDSVNVADLVTKMEAKIHKVVTKFSKDERASQRGTDSQAKVLIEEYMAELMSALHTICWEKPWFTMVDFSAPLLVTTLHTFKSAKIFTRTLGPDIAVFVEAGIFKWAEEDRIQKVMWDAIETCGVKESHRKKASKHLQAAYDEAHLNAPYGSSDNADAGLAMLMDFAMGWMKEFVGRAWDVFENGLDAGCGHDVQVLFVTHLFQTLMDPTTAAVPYEIAAVLQALPSNPWVFIAVTSEAVFKQVALEGATGGGGGKKRKK